MRIGILTYHCQPNFGAQLQAISTVGYLRGAGHEAIVINWYAQDLEEMYFRRVPEEQVLCHQRFTDQALPITTKCQTRQELAQTIASLHLDGILVGSDAVFKYVPLRVRRHFSFRRLRYVHHFHPLSCELLDDNPFFGSFAEDLQPKIPAAVYAASSQNCPYERMTCGERKQMRQALCAYQFISTRDVWTQQMIGHITCRKYIPVFPDPVFAFSDNNYLPIPSKAETIRRFGLKDKYMLLSFRCRHCNPSLVSEIAEEMEKCGYQAVNLAMPEGCKDFGVSTNIGLPLTPIEWYALIIHSCGYVGERMHPIVVCLHNTIPFFSFDEYGTTIRKSRFSKERFYSPQSSKTYQIVADAGLLDNLYSYLGKKPMPQANFVMQRILVFDKDRCKDFSHQMADRYRQGMAETLGAISNGL